MIPAWLSRLGLGAGAAYLKRRLKGEGKEAAGEIRKKMLAKIAKERDKYMPEHLKEKAKKIEFYHPVRNAKDAKKFIKDVLGDKGAKKPKPDASTYLKRKAVIGGLKNVLKGAKDKSDIIGPITALGAGGTLKYIKESKRKKSKSKRNRPDLYPPPKKKRE